MLLHFDCSIQRKSKLNLRWIWGCVDTQIHCTDLYLQSGHICGVFAWVLIRLLEGGGVVKNAKKLSKRDWRKVAPILNR